MLVRMITSKQTGEAKTLALCSAAVDDGTLVEMIYRPGKQETSFLTWHDGQLGEQRFVDLSDGWRAAPYSPYNNLLSHGVVAFASEATAFDSESGLVEEVRAFIQKYVDLPAAFELVAAHYVLFTWVYDAFKEVPYLRVRGDFGTGKSRFLLTVGSLCYKPILASGASTISPLFRILDAFRGTLVLDESDFQLSDERVEIVKILNNGNATGFPVLRSEMTPTREYNPRAFHVFGPKIIASRRAFGDPALESRCITEDLSGHALRPGIPLNLPEAFDGEARILRNKLLMFRFRNLRKSRNLDGIVGPGLEPRVAQIFAPLLATMDEGAAREELRHLAGRYSAMVAAERASSLESQLLEVIADLRRASAPLTVKSIADGFAERFGGDYRRPVTARWVGSLLRSRLSLLPVKSHGTFVLAESEDGKLKKLFERYGVSEIAQAEDSRNPAE